MLMFIDRCCYRQALIALLCCCRFTICQLAAKFFRRGDTHKPVTRTTDPCSDFPARQHGKKVGQSHRHGTYIHVQIDRVCAFRVNMGVGSGSGVGHPVEIEPS